MSSKINLEGINGEISSDYVQLDTFVLPKTKWTVQSLIWIMAIVGKAFNCTKSCLADVEESISKECVTSSVASILVAAFCPKYSPMNVEPDFENHPKMGVKVSCSAHTQKVEGGTLSVLELNPKENPSLAPEFFHRIMIQGISPIVLNLLLPMGLQRQTDVSSKYFLRPFVVGDFNNRNRTDTLIDGIMDTLFLKTPQFNLVDMYSSMVVAKTSYSDKITRPEDVISMQTYEADQKDRELFGSTWMENHEGLIPVKPCHLVELETLFHLIGDPTSETAKSPDNEISADETTFPLHQGFSHFKIELENIIRRNLQECELNPVEAIARLCKLIKLNSGGIASSHDFFPFLHHRDTTSQNRCQLPTFFQICKLLLQGQSSLVDQLLEGNHRQACVANVLGNYDTIKELSLHLLFGDSTVIQVVPKGVISTADISVKQVRIFHIPRAGYFCWVPTKKYVTDFFVGSQQKKILGKYVDLHQLYFSVF
jgi:hypothetical protein